MSEKVASASVRFTGGAMSTSLASPRGRALGEAVALRPDDAELEPGRVADDPPGLHLLDPLRAQGFEPGDLGVDVVVDAGSLVADALREHLEVGDLAHGEVGAVLVALDVLAEGAGPEGGLPLMDVGGDVDADGGESTAVHARHRTDAGATAPEDFRAPRSRAGATARRPPTARSSPGRCPRRRPNRQGRRERCPHRPAPGS